jgi:Leucine-rich repeat (LRR) protein
MDRATTMAIDDLISMQPNAPPPVTDNLARLDKPPSRLSILGKTQNIGRLADFPSVEALWVGDVNERQFNEILPLIDPLYLLFDGLRVADLASLGRLRRLQAIEIRWNTKVTDVSFLENLTNLRLLALSHCPKVHDLSPIAALKNLEILDLSGGMWSTFKPDTLEPLGQLRNLRGLSLKAIRVKDQSLAPVARLKQLQELELSNQFPTSWSPARVSPFFPCPKTRHVLNAMSNGSARCRRVFGPNKSDPWRSDPDEALAGEAGENRARREARIRGGV